MKKAIEELKRLQDKISREIWSNAEAQRQVCCGINMCIGRLSALESKEAVTGESGE